MGTRQGVMVGIVAAGLGVLVAQPLAGTAAVLPQPAAGSAVPQLTVPMPSVSVPSVTTPAVSTPVATVPSGSTPVATVPSVSTPSPTIPSPTIPSPTIPAPTTPSPTIPAVSAPVATVPVRTTASKVSALVGGPTRSAQPSGAPGDPASAAPDSTAATGLAGGATTLSAGGAASGSGAAAAPGMARDPHAALARGRAGAAGRGSPRARRAAAARESRRLRRLVAGLHGCIETLGAGARRLLTLRAGLHGPARSAVATAHILHVSAGREARLERMALIALQRSAGTGCAAPGNGVAPALASAGMLSLSAPQLGGSPSTSTSASASSGPSASLSAAHARRAPRGGRPVDALRAAATVEERADTGSSFPSVLVPALLALVLALALLALPETRRRLRPAAAHSRAGAGPGGQRSAHTLPPAAPIAYSAIAAPHRSDPPRSAAPRTGMDDTLDQMAANIVAQMKRDSPIADTHAEAEAYGLDSQVEVERELLPQGPKVRPSDPLRSHPAPWRPGAWARKHVAQAALVATVLMSGLTRVRRRARRRRRS